MSICVRIAISLFALVAMNTTVFFFITPLSTQIHHSKSVKFCSNFKFNVNLCPGPHGGLQSLISSCYYSSKSDVVAMNTTVFFYMIQTFENLKLFSFDIRNEPFSDAREGKKFPWSLIDKNKIPRSQMISNCFS